MQKTRLQKHPQSPGELCLDQQRSYGRRAAQGQEGMGTQLIEPDACSCMHENGLTFTGVTSSMLLNDSAVGEISKHQRDLGILQPAL